MAVSPRSMSAADRRQTSSEVAFSSALVICFTWVWTESCAEAVVAAPARNSTTTHPSLGHMAGISDLSWRIREEPPVVQIT
jgi:hypothetical protein